MEDTRFEINKVPVFGNVNYNGRLLLGDNIICNCKISVNPSNTWSISGWYTSDKYKNMGYGKLTMKKVLENIYKDFGKPKKIEYIWDGTNDYVYNWMLKNFDPVSKLPIAVQKYSTADEWDAHIYSLDINKVLKYFEVA